MSIMCCVYIPEGIVLAADSRLTRTKTGNITEIPETETIPKTVVGFPKRYILLAIIHKKLCLSRNQTLEYRFVEMLL